MSKINFEEFLCSFIESVKDDKSKNFMSAMSAIKKALRKQGFVYENGKIKKFKVTKGTQYKCIKDVVMDDGTLAYVKGTTYFSEADDCITDEDGNPEHYWTTGRGFFDFFIPDPSCDFIQEKEKHVWEDGDVIKLKKEEDNLKRWKLTSIGDVFSFNYYTDTWIMSELGERSITVGIIHNSQLDSDYEFVSNPSKESKEVLEKSIAEIDKMVPSYLEGYADGKEKGNTELLDGFNQNKIDNMVHHFKHTKENFLDKRVSDIYRKGITDTLEKLRNEIS